jgi:eukaryotic-like serine/threonine-protein kinase
VVGTAKYLSPEQVQGKPLDARSDLYALGIVLYEMLCGRVPFSGENSTSTALARITTDALRPRQVRAGIPRSVEDVVLKAMAREPADRFQSAAAMRGALLAVDLSRVDDQTSSIEATTIADPTPVPGDGELSFVGAERRWLVPAALIVIAAVVLGVVGVIVGQTDVGHNLFGGSSTATTTASQPLTILAPRSFDPQAGDGEHDELLHNLIDGNPGTEWNTQTYDSPTFGTKTGVGVILPLSAVTTLRTLQVDSPTRDWKASVYLAASPQSALAAWGNPVGTLNGGQTIALHGKRAGAVLIWITNLGAARRVAISEVRLTH